MPDFFFGMFGRIEPAQFGHENGVFVVFHIVECAFKPVHIPVHQKSVVDSFQRLDFLEHRVDACGQALVADDEEIIEARLKVEDGFFVVRHGKESVGRAVFFGAAMVIGIDAVAMHEVVLSRQLDGQLLIELPD